MSTYLLSLVPSLPRPPPTRARQGLGAPTPQSGRGYSLLWPLALRGAAPPLTSPTRATTVLVGWFLSFVLLRAVLEILIYLVLFWLVQIPHPQGHSQIQCTQGGYIPSHQLRMGPRTTSCPRAGGRQSEGSRVGAGRAEAKGTRRLYQTLPRGGLLVLLVKRRILVPVAGGEGALDVGRTQTRRATRARAAA